MKTSLTVRSLLKGSTGSLIYSGVKHRIHSNVSPVLKYCCFFVVVFFNFLHLMIKNLELTLKVFRIDKSSFLDKI